MNIKTRDSIAKQQARAKYLQNNQLKRLFLCAKHRAKRRGILFTITENDLIIPEYCPLLGIKITNNYGTGKHNSNASIDRINPKLGYIPGNVQILSGLANRIKTDATPEELVIFAKNILKLYRHE